LSTSGSATPAAEVEDPELVEQLPHVPAHTGKARTAQVRRRCDETDDPLAGLALEDLPQRPAPEVDIQVVEVLDVNRRGVASKVFENPALVVVAVPHPAAKPFHAFLSRLDHLPEVGRIPDAGEDWRLALDAPRPLILLGKLLVEQ